MKRFCAILAFAILLIMAGVNMAVAEENQPKRFKLGFISALSGPWAQRVDTQLKAIRLLVEQVNDKGGIEMPWGNMKVELMVKDDELKLDVGVRRFREMVETGIHGVIGSILNPMAAALNDECKITGTPYMPACMPDKELFEKGNPAITTFSVASTSWSIGYLSADALINGLGQKTFFYQIYPDSYGTVMLEGFKYGCKEFGGEVVGVEQIPESALDYSAVIHKALVKKPDAFIINMFQGDATACLKKAYDMGLHKVSTMVNSWITYDVALGIPDEVASQLYALTYYYYDLDGFSKELADRGRALREDHIKKYNVPPDAYAVLAYTAADVMLQAVEKAQSVDAKKIGKILASAQFETVKGKVRFREDHQIEARCQAFLVKGKPSSERKNKYDIFQVLGVYGGEKALPPLKDLGY